MKVDPTESLVDWAAEYEKKGEEDYFEFLSVSSWKDDVTYNCAGKDYG